MLKWISLGVGIIGLAAASGLLFGESGEGAGLRVSLHGNGAPKESTCFIEGLRHGPTTRWYADGQLRAEGQFEHGEMVGEWILYLPSGEVDRSRSGVYSAGGLLAEARSPARESQDGV